MKVLEVAIFSPLRQLFDYLPVLGVQDDPPIGVRLTLPFGNRQVIGVLVGIKDTPPRNDYQLRHALALVDETPLFSPSMMNLCRWIATYYHHSLGDTLAHALPPPIRRGKPIGKQGWRLAARAQNLPEQYLLLTPKQAQLVELLRGEKVLSERDIKLHGMSDADLRALRNKNLVELGEMPVSYPPRISTQALSPPPALTAEQRHAVECVVAAGDRFTCFLLEGVTGSGKSEVYLQLVHHWFQRKKQVLILVPEIGLTPQLAIHLRRRFKENVAIWHSAVGDRERVRIWRAAREKKISVIVGTRSAVFMPLPDVGLIIVDEEHDPSFKQQEKLHYSARDVAIVRARHLNIPILLGSATPSLESLNNAVQKRYHLLQLTKRIGNAYPLACQVVNISGELPPSGLSNVLYNAVNEATVRGEQALLFINRRGYAPILSCLHCGWYAECTQCSVFLTVHIHPPHLLCHYCDTSQAIPQECARCRSSDIRPSGYGTQHIEEQLRTLFPQVPILRVDRDKITGAGMAKVIDKILHTTPAILIGTQMLAKGHHFPDVTVAGILDADSMIFCTDFRGAERLGQLIVQVGGRSGREKKLGTVFIQTRNPRHKWIEKLVAHGYGHYARDLLTQRAQLHLPPFSHLAKIQTESPSSKAAEQFLAQLYTQWHNTAEIEWTGPIPAPIAKLGGKYRWQLLLSCRLRRHLHDTVAQMIAPLKSPTPKLRWRVDIDPQEI